MSGEKERATSFIDTTLSENTVFFSCIKCRKIIHYTSINERLNIVMQCHYCEAPNIVDIISLIWRGI
jgi:hypothetical protein